METTFEIGLSDSRVKQIQDSLQTLGLDGWLFYSFRKNNSIAQKILVLPEHLTQMRRFFYYIPAKGVPQKLVHGIERGTLDTLPGDKMIYSSWRELEDALKRMVRGGKKVAMEYSPEANIPYISIVDAGTVELVKKTTGAEVVSSADLIQYFDSIWDNEQLELHLEASRALITFVHEAFAEIKNKLKSKQKITEYDVQQFILKRIHDHGMTTEHFPNCSVNQNSGDPHYEPTKDV
ncbi:M24 family metallopeptidase, partial [bacterium]|nr:M24 family metallopeptidase [bacterium]